MRSNTGKGRAWGRGRGWRAVPGGLVCRAGDGCEQGHLHGRQSACHFCSGTCRHQGDRRQRGQDSTADSLSEAAAIKPATSHARSPTTHTPRKRELASQCITDGPMPTHMVNTLLIKRDLKYVKYQNGVAAAPSDVIMAFLKMHNAQMDCHTHLMTL